jgi:hypothetical protein
MDIKQKLSTVSGIIIIVTFALVAFSAVFLYQEIEIARLQQLGASAGIDF